MTACIIHKYCMFGRVWH